MSLSSSLLSPESALRFPSSPGKGQSKCRGRADTFVGAELSSARRCLPVRHGHGGTTQSHPQPPAQPQHWQIANGVFFLSRKGLGTQQVPPLRSTTAPKQLSAGQEETGLNFVLTASFPHFPRGHTHHETFPICFLFLM